MIELSQCAPVAQRIESQTSNLLVAGSNPAGRAKSPQVKRRSCWGDSGARDAPPMFPQCFALPLLVPVVEVATVDLGLHIV